MRSFTNTQECMFGSMSLEEIGWVFLSRGCTVSPVVASTATLLANLLKLAHLAIDPL